MLRLAQGAGAAVWAAAALLLGAAVVGLGLATVGAPPALAQEDGDTGRLVGHGGPVKGVAAHPGGGWAATASFDYAVGLWALGSGASTPIWLDGHRAAVNAVAFLPDGAAGDLRLVTASDDFDLRIWSVAPGAQAGVGAAPWRGHRGKVTDLAVVEDGQGGVLVASAGWDGRIGLWRAPALADLAAAPPTPQWIEGHRGAVLAVALSRDGETLYSGSADGSVRAWDTADGAPRGVIAEHGFAVNVLSLAETDAGDPEWLAYGAADGVVRVLDLPSGAELAALTGDRRPILSIDHDPEAGRLAYGDGQGYLSIARTGDWSLELDVRIAKSGPVWALAFAGSDRILAAGLDDAAAFWPLNGPQAAPALGADGPAEFQAAPETLGNGERQFVRKCSVCHTLTADGGRRAGPTLHQIFGRRAGALPDYAYSEALRGAEITWTEQTVARLFEIGPDVMTPGSKMPMQVIAAPEDRADLVAYLAAAAGRAEASGERP